jgi:hypothetical protein
MGHPDNVVKTQISEAGRIASKRLISKELIGWEAGI